MDWCGCQLRARASPGGEGGRERGRPMQPVAAGVRTGLSTLDGVLGRFQLDGCRNTLANRGGVHAHPTGAINKEQGDGDWANSCGQAGGVRMGC